MDTPDMVTVFIDTNLSTNLVISVSEAAKAQTVLDETAKQHKGLFPELGKVKGERLLFTREDASSSKGGVTQYAVPLKYPLKGLLAKAHSVIVHLRRVEAAAPKALLQTGPATTAISSQPEAEPEEELEPEPEPEPEPTPAAKAKAGKKKGKQVAGPASDATAPAEPSTDNAAPVKTVAGKRKAVFASALKQYKESQAGDGKKPKKAVRKAVKTKHEDTE